MKKQEKAPERYISISAETLEELVKQINAHVDYELVNYSVTTYWMHMTVKHEYAGILRFLHNCE